MTNQPVAVPAWMQQAALVRDYVAENGRYPRQSGIDDGVEKQAGIVLRHFRRLAAGEVFGKTMSAEQRTWLDENLVGWLTSNTRPTARGLRPRRTFGARVRQINRFVVTNGRIPLASSKVQEEKAMGVFLNNHRQAALGRGTISWDESKRKMLNRLVPGWNTPIAQRPYAAMSHAA